MTSAVEAAGARKAVVDARAAEAKAKLSRIDSSIRATQDARRLAENELRLPDYEHRTVEFKGKNLRRQLDSTVKRGANDGWELVSTASPRRDELVATFRRVRRV